MQEMKQAERIQTSILNAAEKKVLVWLAQRQPKWMTSDILTAIGFFGALVIAAGYILVNQNVAFLWLASLGLVINWYGDSLDGTLARVRNTQRPVYGYYLDHTVDAINEVIMFVGDKQQIRRRQLGIIGHLAKRVNLNGFPVPV